MLILAFTLEAASKLYKEAERKSPMPVKK